MALVAAMFGAVYASGCRINITASHPLGLYRIVDRAPEVGLYALFCLPVPRTALPPIDNTRPPCTADSDGYKVLKRIVEVGPGPRYIVEGDHPRSLDSRLFGPLGPADIDAVAVAVRVVLKPFTDPAQPLSTSYRHAPPPAHRARQMPR